MNKDHKVKLVLFSNSASLDDKSKHILGILRHIDRKKFDTNLLCPSGYLSAMAKEISRVNVVNIRAISVFNIFSYIKLKFELNKIRSKKNPFGPLVIHSHGLRAAYIAFRMAPKDAKKIYTQYLGKLGIFKKKLIKRVISKANKVIAHSLEIKKILIDEKLISEDQVVLILDGIDFSKVLKTKRKIKEANKAPIIGAIGDLNGEEGYEYLIDAILKIKVKYPLINLEIIGTGSDKKILEMQVKKLKLEHNVSFLGIKNIYSKYYNDWDVFVSASEVGISNPVLFEMMSAGIPVVATKVGVAPTILTQEKSGILIEQRNSEELTKSVLKLISSPVLAAKIKHNGLERVKNYDWKKMIIKIEGIYSS